MFKDMGFVSAFDQRSRALEVETAISNFVSIEAKALPRCNTFVRWKSFLFFIGNILYEFIRSYA